MKKTRVTTGRRQWTADEHADLWRLKCEGVQLSEIARRLGRDLSSCFGRLKKTDDSGSVHEHSQTGRDAMDSRNGRQGS
jgi:transposase-like protein